MVSKVLAYSIYPKAMISLHSILALLSFLASLGMARSSIMSPLSLERAFWQCHLIQFHKLVILPSPLFQLTIAADIKRD